MTTQQPSSGALLTNTPSPSPTIFPTSRSSEMASYYMYAPSPRPSSHSTPDDTEVERESWIGDSQIAYSCGHGYEADANANLSAQQLDFYFLYKVELGLGGILDTRRFEMSYVFNLASELLSCAQSGRGKDSAQKNFSPYTILEVDSAQPDSLLELGKLKSMYRQHHIIFAIHLFIFALQRQLTLKKNTSC